MVKNCRLTGKSRTDVKIRLDISTRQFFLGKLCLLKRVERKSRFEKHLFLRL